MSTIMLCKSENAYSLLPIEQNKSIAFAVKDSINLSSNSCKSYNIHCK